jgi:hypothetical protein
LGAFIRKRILDEVKMTRTSVARATGPEAKDLRDDRPTSPRAGTSIPVGDTRDDDDDEIFFDAEAGWYVPVSIFTWPIFPGSH